MKFLEATGVFLLGILGAVLGVIMALAFVFVNPVVAVIVGWLTGIFIDLVFGGHVTDGINLLLGTSLADGDLPKITAALWLLGYIVGIRKPINFNFTKNKGENTNGKNGAN